MKFGRMILVIVLCCCLLCGCSSAFHGDKNNLPLNTAEESNGMKKDDTIRLSFFVSYLKERNPDMVKNIIDELNVLSENTIGVYVDYILSDSYDYGQQVESMIKSITAASGYSMPDIFIANSLYGYSYMSETGRDDLVYYVTQNAAADLTNYINEQTPYLKSLYGKYPEIYEMSKMNGRLFGIALPDDQIFSCPVFLVKKSISRQYSINPVTN